MARPSKTADQEQRSTSSPVDSNVSPPAETLPSLRKGSKKRKRSDVMDIDQKKKKKLESADEENGDMEIDDKMVADVKSEANEERQVNDDGNEEVDQEEVKDAGEMCLFEDEAHKILLVLEKMDPQQYLDSTLSNTTTLRKLLTDSLTQSSKPTLREIHEHLAAIPPPPPHPRKPSTPSLPISKPRFIEIARGLIDDVAERRGPSLKRRTLPSVKREEEPATDSRKALRYALVQHLPTGDYFTSASNKPLSPAEVSSLSKGQTSLLAILPSPAIPPSALPTLSSYTRASYIGSKGYKGYSYSYRYREWGTGSHKLSSGTFLNYGLFSSFAPTIDSEGGNGGIGRARLGELRPGKKNRSPKQEKEVLPTELEVEVEDPSPSLILPSLPSDASTSTPLTFTEEELREMEEGLEVLELQSQVSELLTKNARAMDKLQELQTRRLMNAKISSSSRSDSKGKGKAGSVTLGDVTEEERDLAKSIQSTLATLTTLRPRAVASSSTQTSLLPPASTLQSLQSLLPFQPQPGWKGTLVPGRAVALADNTTIRPGAIPTPAPAPPPTQTQRTATPNAQAKKAPTASNVSRTNSQYGTAPGYANPPPRPQPQPQQQAQPSTQYTMYNHYAKLGSQPQVPGQLGQAQPAQAQAGAAAPQYSAYPYYPNYGYNAYAGYPYGGSAWGQQPQQQQAQPQQQQAAAPRAVANLAKAPGTLGTPGPTLPPHLRKGTAAPGTPTPPGYGSPTPAGTAAPTMNGYYATPAAPVGAHANNWRHK